MERGQNADNSHKSVTKRTEDSNLETLASLSSVWRKSWWRGQDLNLRPLGYELTVGLVSYSLV